jgi:type IV fimbrial biogenesis protein FimT
MTRRNTLSKHTVPYDSRTRVSLHTRKQPGFTLIELILTLVAGSILLVIAVPSFLDFQQDNRRTTQLNELVSGLNLARSEAVKSNATVGFCPSASGTGCSATGVYDTGWIVFLNLDADNPPAVDNPAERVLRVHGGVSVNGASLRVNGIASGINFTPTGLTTAAGNITYCDNRGVRASSRVNVSLAGIITTTRPAAA